MSFGMCIIILVTVLAIIFVCAAVLDNDILMQFIIILSIVIAAGLSMIYVLFSLA